MNTTEIILTVITSSIAAAALTSSVNWFIHQSNYKKDFYKKVIEKRMHAYEQAGLVSFDISILTNLGDTVCHTICYSKELYDEFIFKLVGTKNLSFWLSDELNSKLTELNIYLHNEIDNKVDNNQSNDEISRLYRRLGVENFEKIRSFRREIKTLIDSDYRKLHKVKSFLKTNNEKLNAHGVKPRIYDHMD